MKICHVILIQEAQLSPRDPRDALYQLKCFPTIIRITHTDRARVSLRSTFSNCHVLFRTCIVLLLYTNRCTRQNSHNEHAMPCVSSTDFRITHLVDVNWIVTVINQRRLPPLLLTYYSASAPSWTRTTAADWHKGFKQQKWPTFKVTEGH